MANYRLKTLKNVNTVKVTDDTKFCLMVLTMLNCHSLLSVKRCKLATVCNQFWRHIETENPILNN